MANNSPDGCDNASQGLAEVPVPYGQNDTDKCRAQQLMGGAKRSHDTVTAVSARLPLADRTTATPPLASHKWVPRL